MAKRTVRLTESELKKVISESVKQVISELDWKTYRNAAEKMWDKDEEYEKKLQALEQQIDSAYEKNDLETVDRLEKEYSKYRKKAVRGSDFIIASDHAFDRDYLKNAWNRLGNGDDTMNFALKGHTPAWSWEDEGYGKVDGKNYHDSIYYGTWHNKYEDWDYNGHEFNGRDSDALSDDELKSRGFPDNEINDIKKARREIRRYRKGDYEYTKGKGWHLKDNK